MFNMNQFTKEERNIVSRCHGKNEKAVVRKIRRMLPSLSVSELDAALSAIAKLEAEQKDSRIVRAADRAREFALDKLTLFRGWLLLSSTAQLHYCPV